jgi:hypothetical protein
MDLVDGYKWNFYRLKYMFRSISIFTRYTDISICYRTLRLLVNTPSIKELTYFIVQIPNCNEKHFAGSF